MTTGLETVEADLCRYVTAQGNYRSRTRSGPVLKGYRLGQQAARELRIKEHAGKSVVLRVPIVFVQARVEFLGGLLRPLIREQGLDETVKLVTATHEAMRRDLSGFFTHEATRANEKAKKKEREAGLGKWSEPLAFFVPDIGTVVRLKEDWTFRLYSESRNRDAFDAVGMEYNPRSHEELTIKAGSALKVDRVYIRKGAKEYSSITFNVQKGPENVAVAAGREHVFKKKGVRFWAKLSDVNKMVVEVDKATLAEN